MMQSKWFFPVLICVVGIGVYANSLQNGFTFDDWPLVANNPLVMQPDIRAIFSSAYWPDRPDLGLYRPLTTLSFAVNHMVLGAQPWGFHLVNVVLHIVNALLVFVGLRRFFEPHVAGLCGLIFLVHPLQTEAVNGIVGRAELLATFWMLIAWFVYVYCAGRWRWALAALAIFLGCLCKEHAAMMVGVLLVVEFLGWTNRQHESGATQLSFVETWARFYKESLGGVLLCVGVVGVFFFVRYVVVGAVLLPTKPLFHDNPLAHVLWWERGLTALSVILHYALLKLWPNPLSADYSFQALPLVSSFWNGGVWGGLIVVLGLVGLIVGVFRNHISTQWAMAALWIVMPALPVVNLLFPIGTIMAERLMYAPMIGYSMLVAICFWSLGTRWFHFMVIIAIILLGGLSKQTVHRNTEWQNDYTLFESAVQAAPQSAKAHFNFGSAIRDRGDTQRALSHYHKAVWIYPDYAEAHYNLGVAFQDLGRVAKALASYESALAIHTTHLGAWTNIGVLYAKQGVYEKAIEAFNRVLEIDPLKSDVRFNYALVLQKMGRSDEAIWHYGQILDVEPHHEDAVINMAELYVQKGDVNRAIEILKGVVHAKASAHQAALNLAGILEKEGRYAEALDALAVGAQGRGDRSVLALFAAARINGRLGRLDDAKEALNAFLNQWKGDQTLIRRAEEMLRQLNID